MIQVELYRLIDGTHRTSLVDAWAMSDHSGYAQAIDEALAKERVREAGQYLITMNGRTERSLGIYHFKVQAQMTTVLVIDEA